jgi:triacylglycerol lipase
MKVKPYHTKLCKENAYWMARLANAVYIPEEPKGSPPDEDAILKVLQKDDDGFQSVKGFSENSAQAITVEHRDYICISFRGTDEIADWLDNLNAFSMHTAFGNFHKGFLLSFYDVWDDAFGHYKKVRPTTATIEGKEVTVNRPLFLTGHSLGGAIATIASAYMFDEALPFTSAYTFGSPRVMTRQTRRLFDHEANGRIFRFQNNNDLVSRVPFRTLGYRHCGHFLYISEEQKISDDIGWWGRFLDSIDGVASDIGSLGLDSIKDHSMADYQAAIEKWDTNNEF